MSSPARHSPDQGHGSDGAKLGQFALASGALQIPNLPAATLHGNSTVFRKLTGDTLWLSLDQFARLALGFLLNVWLARHLAIEQFALLAFVQATVLFLRQFTTAGLDGILTQELVMSPEKEGRLLGSAAAIRMVYSIVVSVAAITYFWIEAVSPLQLALISLGCLANAFTFCEVIDNKLQAQHRAGVAARLRLVTWSIAALLGIGILKLTGRLDLFYLLLCCAVPLNGIMLWITHRRTQVDPFVFDPAIARHLFAIGWPLLLSALFLALYSRFGQVLLGLYSTPVEVAKFAVSSQLVDGWRILPTLIVTSVFPYLIKLRKHSVADFDRGLQAAFGAFFWGAICICLIYCVAITPIIPLIFGPKYAGAGAITKVQVLTIPFAAWAALVSRVIIVEKATTFSLYRHFAGAAAGLSTAALLIPREGALGAAIATVVAFSFSSFIALFLDPRMARYGRMMLKSVLNVSSSYALVARIVTSMRNRGAAPRGTQE